MRFGAELETLADWLATQGHLRHPLRLHLHRGRKRLDGCDRFRLLADAGYFSEANVNACATVGIDPLIAQGRQSHYPPLAEHTAADPPAPENPTAVEAMAYRLQTKAGKALYALRKQMPEPVFGIIKLVMAFRLFSLRGLDKVPGEWKLVTVAWNIKRQYLRRCGLGETAPACCLPASRSPIGVSRVRARHNWPAENLSGAAHVGHAALGKSPPVDRPPTHSDRLLASAVVRLSMPPSCAGGSSGITRTSSWNLGWVTMGRGWRGFHHHARSGRC